MLRWFIRLGSAAGAIVAIAALWALIGGPRIATSADIQRLDRSGAEMAIEVYNTKLRSLLAISPAQTNSLAYQAWQEELNHARAQLKQAEDRKIDLSK